MGTEVGYLVKIFVDCCFLTSKGTRSLNSLVTDCDDDLEGFDLEKNIVCKGLGLTVVMCI
jgi:hypothetical protein